MNRNKKGSKAPKKPKGQKKPNNSLTSYAAAAVSSSLSQRITFSGGARDGNLKITFRLPIAQIGNSGTTANGGLLYPGGNYTTGVIVNSDSLYDPVVANVYSYWQSVGLNLMAECFSRYKTSGRCKFVYCPQSSSTSTDRLVFGFSSDPQHPLIIQAGSVPTTQANLLGLRESIPFAPWNEWEMSVHVDTLQKYVFSSNEDAADLRLTGFGSMGCVGLSSIVSPTVYGVLYLEGSFEFEDMNPLVVLTSSPPYLKKSRKVKNHNVDDVKEDEVFVKASSSALRK